MPIPLAIPLTVAGVEFLKWIAGNSANESATNKGYAALDQAQKAMQTGADKAIALQQPYTQNAGADFARQRGLVQSGYFQTPYGQSFNPQQMQHSGFTMNPSQGMASFTPQAGLLNSFTPQGLPPMPNMAPYQPPSAPPPQGPQLSTSPQPVMPTYQQETKLQQPNVAVTPPNSMSPTPVYNPQTGQNNPLGQFKPLDPRTVDVQQLIAYLRAHPPGSSGPYGMTGGGMMSGGVR